MESYPKLSSLPRANSQYWGETTTLTEKKKYNGDKVIELFYEFTKNCYRHKGSKYSFYKILHKTADRKTIYKFLDTLEMYDALDKKDENFYVVNSKNFKRVFISYPRCYQAYKILDSMLTISIDGDNVLVG